MTHRLSNNKNREQRCFESQCITAYHLTTRCEQSFNENSDSADAEKIKTHNNEDAHLVTIY